MATVTELAKNSADADPELSFDKSDIERRICFPAGQHTSAGPLLAPVGAAVLTVAFYMILTLFPDAYFAQSFTERSAVPYVIVFFTAWSVMILLVKQGKLALQRKALSLSLLPRDDPGFVLTPDSVELVLRKLYVSVDDPKHFLLTRRIQTALSNVRNMGRIGDVDDVLRSQAENDEAGCESSYTVLRGMIWAIPVLGFIGTVWGLSQALGSFGAVLTGASEIGQLRSALQNVTGGLSTAFETTLQGLVAALCIHMWMTMVLRREEKFLDACKDYCQKNIVGRLRLSAGGN